MMFWFNLYQLIKQITTKKNAKFISKTDNIKIINDLQKRQGFSFKITIRRQFCFLLNGV